MTENHEEIRSDPPYQNGELTQLKLITRQDGHRAPPASDWITDEELWFMDWAFRDTVRELLSEGAKFELRRFEGTPNFPPLLLQKGYGIALCARRSKALRDVGPMRFNFGKDDVFVKKLCNLANDVRKASFRHGDLIWTIRITTFFAQRPPTNAPKWWRTGAELDREECEFSVAAEDVSKATPNGCGGKTSLTPLPHTRKCSSEDIHGYNDSRSTSGASIASPTPSRLSHRPRESLSRLSPPSRRTSSALHTRLDSGPTGGRQSLDKPRPTERPRWRPAG
ncbi:hypothetical protein PFICI_09917 [Pestalotiopsis fici W106-1]|uniref:Uncharacterized protein n=1 Tax=Pestalotiopsis fici (strain W106-1 / CGMCC3.15140) TaxID=1229662 RepID=W3WVI4_PESFW|nr:uncharacterized protein PFICI_09917 [Pestalotiopsis fici W106-1]ETS77855.1 hypothetical protein PFICI_09917 [Pestalotiopsis fici W106-1]